MTEGFSRLGPWWAWCAATAAGLVAWLSFSFGTGWFDEGTRFSISTHGIVLGLCAAATVWAGAVISRRWRRRPAAFWTLVAWTLAFPVWFQFAAVELCQRFFQAAPIYDELGGGTMLERMGTMAGMILLTGGATAALLWWLTQDRRLACVVAFASVAAGLIHLLPCAADPLVSAGAMPQDAMVWVVEVPAPVWQFVVTLGVLRSAAIERLRHERRRCRSCDYDLAGLRAGADRCPECGEPLPRRRPMLYQGAVT